MPHNKTERAHPDRDDPYARRLREHRDDLTDAMLRVLRFIDENRVVALASSAAELARRTRTSDATVIRAVQTLGFSGLPELRQVLTTSLQPGATPVTGMRRTLAEAGHNAGRAIATVLETSADGLKQLSSPAIRTQIGAAAALLHPAERLIVFGIGPSAPIAQYAAFLLRRTGRKAETLDRTGTELADQMLALSRTDALLILAYGPAYREVIAVLDEAERLGIPVVLVTDTPDPDIAGRASLSIQAPRGRAEHFALHGITLVCLEALVLALAASAEHETIATLERLDELRGAIGGTRR
ncbi:MurR/RpiR family transcriptional regulator [Limobrevibacterium gyesilva]|uniref:MurR/RpiR family transcriptional regulator n=1 Tax=Limobrevibacterium gyesilva TaxID=2991712 RepID=A0AA42CI08_9PROT|nr:MurR/RpiR family transcriptional regulator [Limobrevibacterium gyesilva]MCW3475415.1 MurR/RpiR family transcriptional regulator [Limobrevibacterium gyesilva]